MRHRIRRFTPTIVSLATAYDDQSGGDLVIPESFDGLEYAAVESILTDANGRFDALSAEYADTMTDEQVATLGALVEGIEALSTELSARDADKSNRAATAAELATRVQALRTRDTEEVVVVEDVDGEEVVVENEDDKDDENDESAAQTIVASGARGEVRIPMSNVRRSAVAPKASPAKPGMTSVATSSGEGTGFAVGEGLDFLGIGRAIDRKLSGYNGGQFASARNAGLVKREQHSIVAFSRNFGKELTIDSTDRDHVDKVMAHAVNENRLVGKDGKTGLIASGGWCAPSETLYDLLELETRSGLLSLPEIGISRGGIQFTTGPSFQELFAAITGFAFTEQDDIDGKYQPGEGGNVVGPKPCFKIDCPDFEDVRLDVAGLCLTAGLLQSRGYPEVIARTVRGALIAHEHRMNALLIQKLVSGSTAVSMGNQAGTAAPVLDSVEKQVVHYRASHRLSETATLEAVFPMWARGAFRSDLSRRLGVDMLSVTDAQIDGWLRERGVAPQFVYNWQDVAATAASAFTVWPATMSFLLYSAGTWVRGSSPIITLDTIYDSTLLANNDFTALFTEEGWLVAKRGFDSRVVTVGITADGATHEGIDILHNGTAVAAIVPGATEAAPLYTSAVA